MSLSPFSATWRPDIVAFLKNVFTRDNAVGTVSQSGGIPTGALIERGSNANGEYVRFADGTQICWVKAVSVPWINSFLFTYSWTLPASFIDATYGVLPVVDGFGVADANRVGLPYGDSGSPGAATFGLVSNGAYNSGDTNPAIMSAMATGRWF